MDNLTKHTIEQLRRGIATKDLIIGDREQEILRLNERDAYLERANAVLENRAKCYETHSHQQQLTIRGQAMQIIELMAQVREAETIGMNYTAEELDEQEMYQEERKRERLEEERSYRADLLDDM